MIRTEISEKEKNVIIIAYASHYTRVFIDPKIIYFNSNLNYCNDACNQTLWIIWKK